ncbi:Uma2 family endonuclease [Blastopirellula sp. J2-11]|uniref:Uma2 family endonuclease n=1 Tax=Blastopirellula sp. J2-11 TaxID=2943192 RepID=UPI0021C7359F|nr:Uma2 family endonuclease [Blastopirellula sp. J2-11]UUO06717.1 Uma2 family endonuclease [Blastopirellula sp. J2-11]
MASQLELNTPVAPPLPLRRFSVEQYHQLGEIGVLTPEDRVELLEGWIVEKMNQRPIHGFFVRLLNEFFLRELPEGWLCQCQLPVTSERSEPEPDIAIVQGVHADFRNRHPSGADCRLVIEVADTSLERDRAKADIYRTAGVQEYWIVNISDQCLERYAFTDMQSGLPPTLIPGDSHVSLNIRDKELKLDLNRFFG